MKCADLPSTYATSQVGEHYKWSLSLPLLTDPGVIVNSLGQVALALVAASESLDMI